MSSYYTYEHCAGYSHDDHLADEVIARAAAYLGYDTGDVIAQHMGLASHPVPLPGIELRVPNESGAWRRMQAALANARRDVLPHCVVQARIDIACYRWTGPRRLEEQCARCATVAELAPFSGEMTWEGEQALRSARAEPCSCSYVQPRERREGRRWVEAGEVRP
jgi:hypothetical protein